VPVIMLTARGEEHDRILGLELGADDYVTKPFSPRELSLRANSVLRRARHAATPPDQAPDIRRVGDLEVDVTGHQATRGGEPLSLTGREFDLLAFLLAHPGQAFSRAELMQLVWGWDYGDQSTVTVHVRRLREKIEQDPAEPRLLVTVWGVGYRLDPPEAQDALSPPNAAQSAASEPGQRAQRAPAEVSTKPDPASPSRPSNPARPGSPSGAHQ
jgi:DNA-binding response OmpR family regulator